MRDLLDEPGDSERLEEHMWDVILNTSCIQAPYSRRFWN